MEDRPKIKLDPSPLDKKLELACMVILIGMWLLSIYALVKLPVTIPIHYNAAGQPDNYGPKATLLILPSLATFIYSSLTWLNKYPHRFNYITPITETNAAKQYIIATSLLRWLKLSILIICTIIILFTYLTSIGICDGLGAWFLPFMFGLLTVPTVVSIYRSLKKEKI